MNTGQALMDEVLATRVQPGECAYWWLGQMGFLFRLGRWTIAVDPYLEESPNRLSPSVMRSEDLHADFILGTHDHGDHIDRGAWRVIAGANPDTRFIAPAPIVHDLALELGIGRGRLIGISEGTHAFEENGLSVQGIAAAHEFLDTDCHGAYLYTGYIIRANGLTIYHSGDSLKYDGLEAKLRNASPLDIMIVPINGRDGHRYRANCIGNMTFQEAVDLAGAVAPKLSIPAHYDMFEGNTANPMDFADYLEAKYPQRNYWIGPRGTKVPYSR